MRTFLIILSGLFLLGIALVAASRIGATGRMTTAALVFIPVWLLVALANMWMGVARAGYSVNEEFPIFLLIFAVPAVAALFAYWKVL
jgi:hypothetical protein